MIESRIHLVLTLLNLKGIGPAFIIKNEDKIISSLKAQMPYAHLINDLVKKDFNTDAVEEAERAADEEIRIAKESGIRIIDYFSDSFPRRLKDSGFKFPLLYCRGNVDFKSKTIGIVGSRDSTLVGRTIAERLSRYFINKGCSVINGLAEGIDAAAINSAAIKNKTIGIVPGGLAIESADTITKAYKNAALKILEEGGGLVSSFLPSKKQNKYDVVEYCKLQAALSDILILVQSTTEGGTRFTLETFCKLNRRLGVVSAMKFDLEHIANYSANELILKDKKKGLSEICSIAIEKINCTIIPLSDKEDYEKLLVQRNGADVPPSLF